MRALLADQFAPITSAIGFLEASLEETAQAMSERVRQSDGSAQILTLDVPLRQTLMHLEPLTGGVRQRVLLVATTGDWTAYFDSGIHGPDAVSAMRHMSRHVRCRGVAIRCVPHTLGSGSESPGRYGAVQLEIFGPDDTHFLNYVRTISASHDGARWQFDANGEVQPFERTDAYKARRVRDRFTCEMLDEYCAALAIRPFDEDFYLDRARLIESPVAVPKGGKSMSLEQAQAWLGIVPGAGSAGQRP